MFELFYQWIDFIWLPVGWFLVEKEQRLKVALYFLICIFTLRTQIELMESIDFPNGILGWVKFSLYHRGLVIYSLINVAFLAALHHFPATKGVFLIAFMLSVYVAAFCVSMLAMVF